MQILKLDPRALKDNPDDARRSKSSPQADALLLATVKAVANIQPASRLARNRRREWLHHPGRSSPRAAGDRRRP